MYSIQYTVADTIRYNSKIARSWLLVVLCNVDVPMVLDGWMDGWMDGLINKKAIVLVRPAFNQMSIE